MIPDAYFDRFETPKYRRRSRVRRALIRRFVRRLHELILEAGPVSSMLEIGIGEGFLSGYLSEKLPTVRFCGVDSSAQAVARLRLLFPRIEACVVNHSGLVVMMSAHFIDAAPFGSWPSYDFYVRP